MDKTFDTVLKERMQQVIKEYLSENLAVIVETESVGTYSPEVRVIVKLSVGGEVINSGYDTIYLPGC